jgi:hypothetical protein
MKRPVSVCTVQAHLIYDHTSFFLLLSEYLPSAHTTAFRTINEYMPSAHTIDSEL